MIIPAFSKTYGQKKVLDFPGMELQPGNIYAILGANGSGKSTFSKILADVLPADRKIHLESSIGYLPQKPYAFRMSVRKNVLLGGRDIQKAESLAKALSLTELEHKRADRLSGGETARMAMARLMMGTYDVVILDEPTAGLDVEGRLSLHKQIRQLKAMGKTIILASHDMAEVENLCDRIAILSEGKIAFIGTVEQLGETVGKRYNITIQTESSTEKYESDNIGETLLSLLTQYKEKEEPIVDIQINRGTLEQHFMRITKEAQ